MSQFDPLNDDDSFADLPVLVTGGAGFIGSHLVETLLARGAQVRVLDDLSAGKRENLEPFQDRLELIVGDIRDLKTCERACAGVAVVFHQAALGSVPRSMARPADTIAVNVAGTANVFTAARDAGVRRVVYASSSSVYGSSEALPKREGEEGRPLSPYALSKAMNEHLAEVFHRCFGLEMLGLRYFNVYGPRQDPDGPYAAVIPRFFKAILHGEPPVIYGDGAQSRDFTWVGDAVAANLLAAQAPSEACGRAYNVAAGRATTVLELARAVAAALGCAVEPAHEVPRAGDVLHSRAEVSRAEAALGFRAKTTLSEGLSATLSFFCERFAPGSGNAG